MQELQCRKVKCPARYTLTMMHRFALLSQLSYKLDYLSDTVMMRQVEWMQAQLMGNQFVVLDTLLKSDGMRGGAGNYFELMVMLKFANAENPEEFQLRCLFYGDPSNERNMILERQC